MGNIQSIPITISNNTGIPNDQISNISISQNAKVSGSIQNIYTSNSSSLITTKVYQLSPFNVVMTLKNGTILSSNSEIPLQGKPYTLLLQIISGSQSLLLR